MERACLKIFVREIFKTWRKVCCEKKEEKKEEGKKGIETVLCDFFF